MLCIWKAGWKGDGTGTVPDGEGFHETRYFEFIEACPALHQWPVLTRNTSLIFPIHLRQSVTTTHVAQHVKAFTPLDVLLRERPMPVGECKQANPKTKERIITSASICQALQSIFLPKT